MDSRTVWSAESRQAWEAVAASVAALAVFTGAGADQADAPGSDALRDAESGPPGVDPFRDVDPFREADPLRDLADACLDGLAGM
ncbi:MAG TPA: hypothetical protein VLR70_16755, partial [Arthrobacter sp.]|nr:hypothetical protein [Arthrobacter sp.]